MLLIRVTLALLIIASADHMTGQQSWIKLD